MGERWALLVVRELLLGPKRFTDLRVGLPAASPNVLSQRLHELERTGIVRRRKLAPPAGAWVYELTEWGREIEPIILALGRWGSHSPSVPVGDLSVDALLIALKTTFDSQAAQGLSARYELRLGEERFRVKVTDGQIDIERGGALRPDTIIETDTGTLRSLVFGGRPLDTALATGEVALEGDWQLAERFFRLFPRPEPVSVARGEREVEDANRRLRMRPAPDSPASADVPGAE